MNMHEKFRSDDRSVANQERLDPSRREFLVGVGGAAVLGALAPSGAFAQVAEGPLNIARVAIPTSQVMASENRISALNDGFTPADSFDRTHALYTVWADRSPGAHTSWVQYEWSEPVDIDKVEIYWAVDHPRQGDLPGTAWRRLAAPESYRILVWNSTDFVSVILKSKKRCLIYGPHHGIIGVGRIIADDVDGQMLVRRIMSHQPPSAVGLAWWCAISGRSSTTAQFHPFLQWLMRALTAPL